ncbi:hypothetical protein Cni_G01155 [Canna indica]|uniref:C3H1-type domain-containing protein n=1 Tax=Canna indica TaxID=4628 RepID=A0AAQ3JM16_9LILI|nr:hypothetical protein Cni_G01155 [Canna indica]
MLSACSSLLLLLSLPPTLPPSLLVTNPVKRLQVAVSYTSCRLATKLSLHLPNMHTDSNKTNASIYYSDRTKKRTHFRCHLLCQLHALLDIEHNPNMDCDNNSTVLVLPCYRRLSEAARLAYGVSKAELDDFLMYEFKVRRCAKAYPHQWMTCPFAHRGEKARRRDPRKFPSHGIPCPEFRQTGACLRGQRCEFAHGVFEFWLHPTRYRTRMCISGLACTRKICFFAHSVDELRPEGAEDRGSTPAATAGGGRTREGTNGKAEGSSSTTSQVRWPGEKSEEPDIRWVYELVD